MGGPIIEAIPTAASRGRHYTDPLLGVTVPTVAARGRLCREFWGRKPRGRQGGLNPSWTNDVFGITVIISNKK